jgi:hypothetical protein
MKVMKRGEPSDKHTATAFRHESAGRIPEPMPNRSLDAGPEHGARSSNQQAVTMLFVRHLKSVYRAFDGELLEAIVLGEVGHHNLSAYFADAKKARRSGQVPPPMPKEYDYLPTNTHSIAQATGIPRETVRRKVKALVSRGWLQRRRDRSLILTPVPFEHFRELREELTEDFLSTSKEVILLNQVQRARPRVRPQAADPFRPEPPYLTTRAFTAPKPACSASCRQHSRRHFRSRRSAQNGQLARACPLCRELSLFARRKHR